MAEYLCRYGFASLQEFPKFKPENTPCDDTDEALLTDTLVSGQLYLRKLTFRALALRRSESRNCGLCVVYIQREELRYWLVPGNVKNNRIN